MLRRRLAVAVEGARQLLGHHLDDEAHAQTQHLVEQLRLGAYEHGQVDHELLRQHGRAFVVPIGLEKGKLSQELLKNGLKGYSHRG